MFRFCSHPLSCPRSRERDPNPHDEEMIGVAREVGASEGIFVCPEAAACFAALKSLHTVGKIASGERVVIFNTGSGIDQRSMPAEGLSYNTQCVCWTPGFKLR